MKKARFCPNLFGLGLDPSSETTVIRPSCRIGHTKHVAVTAPRGQAGTRAFGAHAGGGLLSAGGGCECSSRCRLGAGGL